MKTTHEKRDTQPMRGWVLVRAEEIDHGCCFVKRTAGPTGFAYLRISESAVRYYNLDKDLVYGICYNGNMTALPKDKLVWRVPVTQMDRNRGNELAWEQNVGCIESSPYLEDEDEEVEPFKVGFLRFNGQDSAYVYTGSVFEAVKRAYQDPGYTLTDFRKHHAEGEFSYTEENLTEGMLLDVGDKL